MDKLPFTTLKILFTPYPWKYLISFKYLSESRYCNTEKALYSTICQISIPIIVLTDKWVLLRTFPLIYGSVNNWWAWWTNVVFLLIKCCSYFVWPNKKALACWNIQVLVICIYHWLKLAIWLINILQQQIWRFLKSVWKSLYISNP